MEDSYLNYKREVEKINQRIKVSLKNDIPRKLDQLNQKIAEIDFWKDKANSQKIIKEKNFLRI